MEGLKTLTKTIVLEDVTTGYSKATIMSREQIRVVEELRDIFKGEEVWILGAGQSLDDFPIDFFYDKKSIALNGAIYNFPNCNYWHGHHEVWREYLRDEKPEFLEKSIICYPFPGPFYHDTPRDPVGFFGEMTSIPYWLYFLDSCVLAKHEFMMPVNDILEKRDIIRFRACCTVAHIAMQIAFLMGAKKISLVGCEHRNFPNQDSHVNIGITYPAVWGGNEEIFSATKWLAEIFAEYGVEMQRYYNVDTDFYKKGYEII
jgi:hypothetical protein